MLRILITILFIFSVLFSKAQHAISEADKAKAVKQVINLMNENYIFPEKAKEMEDYLLVRLKNNGYGNTKNLHQFAAELTKDLVFISNDKHIRVTVDPQLVKQLRTGGMESAEFIESVKQQYLQNNYFFSEISVLPGNIGYLNLKGFAQPDAIAEDKVAAAMELLKHTEAIIIDLRENGGGSPEMVRLISSYFFDKKPVHLNSLYFRRNSDTLEFWTLDNVKGTKMPDKPLYILTSSYTFSGAEEFAYNMNNLNRATIIGETTGGGAHPGEMMVVSDDLVVFVPIGKAINPVSKINWEGTGVEPDLKIIPSKALDLAYFTALNKLNNSFANEQQKQTLKWLIPEVEAKLNPVTLSAEQLQNYIGNYDDIEIQQVNNELFIKMGRYKYLLKPLNESIFEIDKLKNIRVQFNRYYDRKISELSLLYNDGRSEIKKKSK